MSEKSVRGGSGKSRGIRSKIVRQIQVHAFSTDNLLYRFRYLLLPGPVRETLLKLEISPPNVLG